MAGAACAALDFMPLLGDGVDNLPICILKLGPVELDGLFHGLDVRGLVRLASAAAAQPEASRSQPEAARWPAPCRASLCPRDGGLRPLIHLRRWPP